MRTDETQDDGATDAAGDDRAPAPCYTPQQVRFTDARGVLWTVRCAHRLRADELAPRAAPVNGASAPDASADPTGAVARAALPVLIDDEGVRIAACRAGRCWLEFVSRSERRRLRLVPPRWYTLSTAALALLCEEAAVEARA